MLTPRVPVVVFGAFLLVVLAVVAPGAVNSPTAEAQSTRAEWVYVLRADISSYSALVIRENYEYWVLDYGIGCLSLWRYEGDWVLVTYRTFFAGIGSSIVIPERGQSCRIWTSRQL